MALPIMTVFRSVRLIVIVRSGFSIWYPSMLVKVALFNSMAYFSPLSGVQLHGEEVQPKSCTHTADHVWPAGLG